MKKTLLFFPLLLSFLLLETVHANTRTMSVKHLLTGQSYFKVTVWDDGLLNGEYAGWCADWNTRIEDDTLYHSRFYSSIASSLPTDVVDHPEYLDEVNWLINQNFVGKPAPDDLGVYTIGDVQLALWSLIDDEFDSATVGSYLQARVDILVARAKLEGANFNPGCMELVSIILIPSDPTTGSGFQNTIILVPRYRFPKCVVPDSDEE